MTRMAKPTPNPKIIEAAPRAKAAAAEPSGITLAPEPEAALKKAKPKPV